MPGKPEHVFPLLCPTLEYDWIEGWNAWLIHSDSGVAEPGAVFRTRIGTGETWIMTHSERNRRAQYTVFTGAAVMVLDILLSDNGDGTTTVEWTRTYTATSRVGRRVIRRFADDAIRGEIAAVHHSLDHFLRTGQKLPRADALRLAADSARTLEQGVCS